MTIPDHWAFSTVGQLFDVLGGGTPSTEEKSFWDGDVPWVTSADIDDSFNLEPRRAVSRKGLENSPAKAVPKNSIIVVTRVGLGKVGIVRHKQMSFSQDCQALPPVEGLDSRFVAYQMKFIALSFAHKARGTTISGITKNQLEAAPFHLAPEPEQSRIADSIGECLADVDVAIAALNKVRIKLQHYRLAVLKAALRGKLTASWRKKNASGESGSALVDRILVARKSRWESANNRKFKEQQQDPPKNWRSKYKEPVAIDTSKLAPLPATWCWSNFGRCFEIHGGATPSRDNARYWKGKIPWVASGEVQFCRIGETREKISSEGLAASSTQLNPKGSVMLNMIGEGKTRGKAGILEIDACNNQNCAAIWVSQTPIQPEYIYAWLLFRYEETRQLGAGNNQSAMNKGIVEAIPFPVPPPGEQDAIVDLLEGQLSTLDHVEAEIASKLLSAETLKLSVLRAAFSGRLTPLNPKDESASKLLERILASKHKPPRPSVKGVKRREKEVRVAGR